MQVNMNSIAHYTGRVQIIPAMLRIQCAWCGKWGGWIDGQGVRGISHTICPPCFANIMAANNLKAVD